mgnify:CR=1 FL=1
MGITAAGLGADDQKQTDPARRANVVETCNAQTDLQGFQGTYELLQGTYKCS